MMAGQQSAHNMDGKEKLHVRSTLRRAAHHHTDNCNGTTPRADYKPNRADGKKGQDCSCPSNRKLEYSKE